MLSAQRAIFIAGMLFLTVGAAFLALDQWRMSTVLQELNLAGSPQARKDASMEEGNTLLRQSEEYLSQNSIESARKAHDGFVRLLSLDLTKELNQKASYGIAASLDRLGDRSRAVEHLRDLRDQGVSDPTLREKTEYLLGRLLILFGHDEEGKSILQELLAETQNPLIKSRIHTTFGDYYRLTGEKKKAERNYRIALEYAPANLHAEVERAETLDGQPRIQYYYHDDYLIDSSLKTTKKPATKHKPARETRKKPASEPQSKVSAKELYERGVRNYRDQRYPEAISNFEQALAAGPNSELRERILYWMAESFSAGGEMDRALQTYGKVLENPSLILDQRSYIQRGRIYFDREDLKRAYEEFKRAANEFPNGTETRTALEWKREVENVIRDRQNLKEGE
ncbi:MAG: tetratricopeptide repeat protein [Leptospiraceae bacterium]|nr:tetratricopeptide repeat protein [Leptospiraceae bacterium]